MWRRSHTAMCPKSIRYTGIQIEELGRLAVSRSAHGLTKLFGGRRAHRRSRVWIYVSLLPNGFLITDMKIFISCSIGILLNKHNNHAETDLKCVGGSVGDPKAHRLDHPPPKAEEYLALLPNAPGDAQRCRSLIQTYFLRIDISGGGVCIRLVAGSSPYRILRSEEWKEMQKKIHTAKECKIRKYVF